MLGTELIDLDLLWIAVVHVVVVVVVVVGYNSEHVRQGLSLNLKLTVSPRQARQ